MTWREWMILGGYLVLAALMLLFAACTWLWDHVVDPLVGRYSRKRRAADRAHVARAADTLGIGHVNCRCPVEPIGVTRDRHIRAGLASEMVAAHREDFTEWGRELGGAQ